ncbi:MAG: ATP-dependent sacrificial sulfur transferase LarE [Candidatus Eisenbacteria bacterium]|uniref:ATP-dependent sacrificial sulfur transferase LarE n=1 Tax=Eiseniibacteriota bacterium TaxID=2212470 RepID=A0A538TP88_UNCEI|nr:MAG: ATP-dependent sacrificial sulfur transferase LarE [Candidatus Eisenbacteria bacterium]
MGRTLVAYSGGVDSAYLLAEASQVLGPRALGVIAKSPSLPGAELTAALSLAASRGIGVRVIETREMERTEYRANGPDRCFHCKAELFERLTTVAAEEGWATIAYGALTDDLGDVRPGMAAAGRFRVRAPLLEAGLGKLEVRLLARDIGLRVWDKPQSACLASRIPHGSPVTVMKLSQVEQGEAWLREALGLRVARLRHEGTHARIEVLEEDIARISGETTLSNISFALNRLGFMTVEIDPRGYRRPDPQPAVLAEERVDGERR